VNILLVKALAAFLALPGVVAFAIPLWLLRRPDRTVYAPGLLVVALGAVVLLRCVRDFYAAGKGTLAPWSPPVHLVTIGLYHYSRNPMYLGVLTILFGWAATFWSRGHLVYALAFVVIFHVRVIAFEEPWLAETHGDGWRQYRARVPRWLL
jgi:protein-S-isoprenylcysteine O-methyltransferase Ste14